ncbi:hypothetical protein SAMN05216223_102181 [Actinacidiphila yanglinensis]|uniref:Lipoprotein n=1 Tax=Actinacidiphila yanglinensis TaxID=310779 RepID=A0A1H5V7G5_9ACTN|nr:hypothetical protein [Actinacidiphila yanglinensis]SEF83160.1 hypothetical protein SAMN05216223_102181 [Actinacidiphila yanglinensis]
MHHGRRTVVAALAALGASGLLTGCLGFGGDPDAGTNGVGKLPPQTIEQKAKSAAAGAAAVRLAGTVVSGGRTYRLDMRLRADGGVGEVSSKGATFQLLRVGDDLYLKAGADFYGDGGSDANSKAAAAKLNGKYVKVPPDDPSYQQFSGFTNKKTLLAELFVLDGTLRTGAHRKVGSTRTIALDGSKGGSLDVSLKGSPYPLRYQRAGDAGTLTLSDWGEEFSLAAPAKSEVLDYGKTVGK